MAPIDTPKTAAPRRIDILGAVPFILIHLSVFAVFWTGVTWQAVVVGLALFWVRLLGVTAGYHRYFSHRTFKTSRWLQFVMAFVAQSTAQRGVLWWAAHHRRHHKYSDLPGDVHSPVLDPFWYSHVGWIFDRGNQATDYDRIKDFAQYPELRFLERHYLLPPFLVAIAVFLLFGWSGLVVGFFASTVALWHATFTINSLSHVFGKRRFATTDDSRNNWMLALLTLGEGWHNNHHHYQSATRQGFYWWEVDITYYVLKAMSWVGLVWDIREPPKRVLDEGRALDAQKRKPEEAAPASLVPPPLADAAE